MRIVTIIGFIFTGVLSGPYGLGLINNIEAVDIFSKVGIVLLLFTIGMEFSLRRVLQYKRYFLLGGSIQVVLTILSGFNNILKIFSALIYLNFPELVCGVTSFSD